MGLRFSVKILQQANDDVREALTWLQENAGAKIRDQFFKDYRHTKTRLRKTPGLRHPFHQDFRKIRLSRFPYKIIYRIEGDVIYIVAVAHDARDDYWQNS
jgi:plasmid stabilization system protein ParE